MDNFDVFIIGFLVGIVICVILRIGIVNDRRVINCIIACKEEGYNYKGYTLNIGRREIDCECQEKYKIISIRDDNFG